MEAMRELCRNRLDAIEVAWKAYENRDPAAGDSIRQIAHSLAGSTELDRAPEVRELARALEGAAPEYLGACLEQLLEALRDAAFGVGKTGTRILVVDDDPVTAHHVKTRLTEQGRVVDVASTGAQAEQMLADTEYSLILLDLLLPDLDARNLIIRWRERPVTSWIPILVMSGRMGPRTKADCLALGADGYFEKPLDMKMLGTAITARLYRSAQMMRELRHDPLTGLPNRAALGEAYQRAREQSGRSGEPLSLALIDFDHFKAVNDTHGHPVGDEVLRRAARIMGSALRPSDFLARWGGEEFVALLPETAASGGVLAVQRALEAMRNERIGVGQGDPLRITFSAGVTQVEPDQSLNSAIYAADRLLYLAKAAGRDRVTSREEGLATTPKRILVAEDDPVTSSLLVGKLQSEGYQVEAFAEGTSALARALEAPPSLVLLDVKMPGLDGFEVLKSIRARFPPSRLPIVVVTSLGAEQDILRGFELGADDYVLKPFAPAELLARVRRLLSRG